MTLYGITINGNTATGIEVDAGRAVAINAPLVLQNSQQWIDNSANGLTVNGNISGSSGLTKSGTGGLTITGSNTYTGATGISAGTLIVGGNVASGAAGPLGNSTSAVTIGDVNSAGNPAAL